LIGIPESGRFGGFRRLEKFGFFRRCDSEALNHLLKLGYNALLLVWGGQMREGENSGMDGNVKRQKNRIKSENELQYSFFLFC